MSDQLAQSLLVDSSFQSRRTLMQDLQATGMIDAIVEAKSIDDGLQRLQSGAFEAAIVGPSISKIKALSFVRSATAVCEEKHCSIIVVLHGRHCPHREFRDAGVHGIVESPYNRKAFTKMVRGAIEQARRNRDLVSRIAQSSEFSVSGNRRSLPVVLDALSAELHSVAQRLLSRDLTLDANGSPTPHTQAALYSALRVAFQLTREEAALNNFDQYFVSSLVDWFEVRVHQSEKAARDMLRKRLLSYRPESD